MKGRVACVRGIEMACDDVGSGPAGRPQDAAMMRREIRGSRLEIIEGASPLSNIERPAEFNRVLKDFLDALQP